jgi:hypothetical protein
MLPRPRSPGSLTLDSVYVCVDTNNIAAQNNVETSERAKRKSGADSFGLRFW